MSLLLASLVTSLAVSGASSAAVDHVTYFVDEELPVGSVVGNVMADFNVRRRYDPSTLATVSFELLTQPTGGYLALDTDGWDVVVARTMDRESLCVDDERCLLQYIVAVRPLHLFRQPAADFFPVIYGVKR